MNEYKSNTTDRSAIVKVFDRLAELISENAALRAQLAAVTGQRDFYRDAEARRECADPDTPYPTHRIALCTPCRARREKEEAGRG